MVSIIDLYKMFFFWTNLVVWLQPPHGNGLEGYSKTHAFAVVQLWFRELHLIVALLALLAAYKQLVNALRRKMNFDFGTHLLFAGVRLWANHILSQLHRFQKHVLGNREKQAVTHTHTHLHTPRHRHVLKLSQLNCACVSRNEKACCYSS